MARGMAILVILVSMSLCSQSVRALDADMEVAESRNQFTPLKTIENRQEMKKPIDTNYKNIGNDREKFDPLRSSFEKLREQMEKQIPAFDIEPKVEYTRPQYNQESRNPVTTNNRESARKYENPRPAYPNRPNQPQQSYDVMPKKQENSNRYKPIVNGI